MRLLLLLLLYPVIVTPQCAPGDINGSCARIKPNQYQLRGVRVKPYWTHVIYGGRDIRRRQSSNAMQAFEKPAMEFNLRPPPMYAAQRLPQPVQRFPLNPIQAQNSALNKDPIDSFERAIGGDEFDDRPPVEPIRVIKIESAEVIEPVGSSRKMGSNPVKTKKIIQSLTRHLNEVRRPKVIPFSNRDEIINGQVVSQPEVKVTKVEAEQETETAADMDVSSSEIANGILENILNENSFAKNASDLLRVLTKPEQTTTEANEASNGTETGDSSIEVSTELTGSADNDTDSSFLNFDNIDEKLNVIGSEVDDYGVDEEWEEFSSADGGSAVSRRPRPPGRASTRRATAAPVTSTISPRGSITTSSPTTSPTTRSSGANNTTSQAARTPSIVTTSTTTTSTTTTAPQSGEAAPELEADLDESKEESAADEEAVATTATTSASSTSAPPASTAVAEEEDSDKSTESSEESSDDEEETTAITTTAASEAATTTTTFDDGFREAVKAQQAEVLRMRKGGNNEEKAIEAGSSEGITELNSETIKSIEEEKKKKKRTKKVKKEEDEEEDDDEEDKEKPDLPEGVEQALRQNLAGIQGKSDDKEEKKKVKKGKKTEIISEDISKTIGEVITENLRSEIDSISKEDNENKEQDEEEDSAKEENDDEEGKPRKRMKKKERKEEKGEEDEEEPVGGGAQPLSPDEENTLRAEIKHSQETTVTIKKPRKVRGRKTKGKKGEEKREEDKQEEENDDKEKDEEENNDVEKKEEEIKEDEEKPDDEVEVTTPVSENVEDEKPEITDEDKPEDAEEEKPTKKKGKKGKEKQGKKKDDEEEEAEEKGDAEEGDEEKETSPAPPKVGGDNHDIRTGNLTASLKDAPNAKYYYPPKVMVPLPSCFYNPSGYVCCNLQLNNLIEDTFEEIKNVQGYSACNIAKVANIMQQKSEQMFEHPFESIVALSDFAQNVHFAGDLVCKVEIDGKYMLTYATPYDADHAVEAVGVAETPPPEMNEMRGKDGKRKTKKPNKAKKKSLPIHNFRM
ncbi:hypothetical protein Y032_0574g184 [Ancylostoma ceylanicum]|uniref:Ground-like domain-containing protein n=2 Tax=Ancylostoma ceylanicum TaxID=53326 RepID=A0A016WNX2_9BILA|nr:hypothetical protein Y032_0574g184 [Ancylostoma ceylanicum]